MELDLTRWVSARPFLAVGTVGVVAGGLVAAATAPTPSEHGSWAAAYLVLVVGVAQIALGAGQATLASRVAGPRLVWGEIGGWNLGNAAVIVGTLAGWPVAISIGGVLLVAALALFVYGVHGAHGADGAERADGAASPRSTRLRWPLFAFRALVLLLLVSIPVGLVLASVKGQS